MKSLTEQTPQISKIVREAADKARAETDNEPEPEVTRKMVWPAEVTLGPGLEGAIACESKVGYVNGTKGWLVYRGYNIFDLCAHSSFEEVSYLLIHGKLPSRTQLDRFDKKLKSHRYIPRTLRHLMSYPVEELDTMASLRLGTNFLRQIRTEKDSPAYAALHAYERIGADEDSTDADTERSSEKDAVYTFAHTGKQEMEEAYAEGREEYYQLISAMAALTAAIGRLRAGKLPVEPHPDLSHAGNLLYMLNGKEPTPEEERIMDIALILHADHGMNASTFASMVVASTMSDIYFSIGAGIGALSGPLHGGANEAVLHMLREIGPHKNVESWYAQAMKEKKKIMGFGHRVYKAYDPRARVLGPLARHLASQSPDRKVRTLFKTAEGLEHKVVSTLGKEKLIFPNVDFYSGIVYHAMGLHESLFTPLFAVSRVSGWIARVMEYLENNRIFRPRAVYTGKHALSYLPLSER